MSSTRQIVSSAKVRKNNFKNINDKEKCKDDKMILSLDIQNCVQNPTNYKYNNNNKCTTIKPKRILGVPSAPSTHLDATSKAACDTTTTLLPLRVSATTTTKTTPKLPSTTLKTTTATAPTKTTPTTSFQTVLPTMKILQNSNRISTRAKFCVSLLILVIAIAVRSSHASPVPTKGYRLILHTTQYRQQRHQQLLQEQRSRIHPTPRRHHHMQLRSPAIEMQQQQQQRHHSGANNRCQVLTAASLKSIKSAQRQANATFYQLYNSLSLYTRAQHEEDPKDFYGQFKKQSLNMSHPLNDYTKKVRNIDLMPEDIKSDMIHIANKPFTLEMLQTEIGKVNQTLRSMDFIFDQVMQFRNENKVDVDHDLHRRNESIDEWNARIAIVNNFFDKVRTHLKQDIFYTQELMDELQVPQAVELTADYSQRGQLVESLLLQEHLAIMKYLVAMYTYVLEHCDGAVEAIAGGDVDLDVVDN